MNGEFTFSVDVAAKAGATEDIMTFQGIASSTGVDRQGEKFTEKALDSMASQVPMVLAIGDHQTALVDPRSEIGKVESFEVVGDELHIDGVFDPNHPDAAFVHSKMQADPDAYKVSVSGRVPSASTGFGKARGEIEDIALDHILLCRASSAINQDCAIQAGKAEDWADAVSKAATDVYQTVDGPSADEMKEWYSECPKCGAKASLEAPSITYPTICPVCETEMEWIMVDGEVIEDKAQGRNGGELAAGPDGECVCPKCNKTVAHDTGEPCTDMVCPECGTGMTRLDEGTDKALATDLQEDETNMDIEALSDKFDTLMSDVKTALAPAEKAESADAPVDDAEKSEPADLGLTVLGEAVLGIGEAMKAGFTEIHEALAAQAEKAEAVEVPAEVEPVVEAPVEEETPEEDAAPEVDEDTEGDEDEVASMKAAVVELQGVVTAMANKMDDVKADNDKLMQKSAGSTQVKHDDPVEIAKAAPVDENPIHTLVANG